MRLAALALAVSIAAVPARARACGGGLVTSEAGGVGADAQRIFLTPSDASTTVVTEVTVPVTSADYGVLLPLPARPTLDPRPVNSLAFEDLDFATAPHLVHEAHGGGFGLGCGSAPKSLRAGTLSGSVSTTPPVEIGPLSAVTLTGDDGTAVTDWLSSNGFALPAEGKALIDAYAGPGHFFVALKRSQGATDGGASTVGVRFTLPGDQRTLPLRFARLGGAARVAFTVYVAARAAVGPESPFQAFTVDRLDARLVSSAGYAAAVAKAVADRGNRAFLVESVHDVAALPSANALLAGLADRGLVVTRLSTVVAREDLTADATLSGPAPATIPGTITLPAVAGASALPLGLLLLCARRRSWRR